MKPRLLRRLQCVCTSCLTAVLFSDLQATELGMTSAFYKYILTTMVRAASSVSLFCCSLLLPSLLSVLILFRVLPPLLLFLSNFFLQF